MPGTNNLVVSDYVQKEMPGFKPFIPGGKGGTLNEAGVDAMGLLTGSVAMTSFYDRIYD